MHHECHIIHKLVQIFISCICITSNKGRKRVGKNDIALPNTHSCEGHSFEHIQHNTKTKYKWLTSFCIFRENISPSSTE